MQLMTTDLMTKLPALYTTSEVSDPIAVLKFFDPVGSWTWYVVEGSVIDAQHKPQPNTRYTDEAEVLFYGLVHGFETESGYFRLSEIRDYRGPLGIGLERDLNFRATPLSTLRAELAAGRRP